MGRLLQWRHPIRRRLSPARIPQLRIRRSVFGEAGGLGCLLECRSWGYVQADDELDREDKVVISLTSLKDGTVYTLNETRLDRQHHNTYREWQRLGSLPNPSPAIIDRLIKTAELSPDATSQVQVENSSLVLSFAIPRHSMVLFELVPCSG